MINPRVRASAAMAAMALFLAACTGQPSGTSTDQPTDEVSASAIPTVGGTATDGPSSSASPSGEPTDDPSAEPRDPTDTDRARFAASYRPEGSTDLEHVQVDVDGDGMDEIVFAYVRGGEGVGHVDVADWNEELGQYEIVAGADGGVADRVDRVRIGDLNLDGVVEVALFQGRGSTGASVTLWAVGVQRLVPMVARGGCWDGLSTYGVIGVQIEDRDGDGSVEIYASCDDSPLPSSAWSTDGYSWQGSWTHDPNL